MKDIKDNFSNQAEKYATFRPTYPDKLYEYIYKHCKNFNTAWDCATGNGQAAVQLSSQFNQVIATDISQKQIDNAVQRNNIQYLIERAEKTSIPDNSINLITVAQAAHWFDFTEFQKEVLRVSTANGILAMWGYSLLHVNNKIDTLIKHLYIDILGDFWDEERKHVDNTYQSIPFPFDEIESPEFSITYQWSFEQMIGYLSSWSSVRHYINKNNSNPIQQIEEPLRTQWGGVQQVTFPIFLRLGKIK